MRCLRVQQDENALVTNKLRTLESRRHISRKIEQDENAPVTNKLRTSESRKHNSWKEDYISGCTEAPSKRQQDSF